MIYRAIGLTSSSSLNGLDIAYTAFTETGRKWAFDILEEILRWREEAIALSTVTGALQRRYWRYIVVGW